MMMMVLLLVSKQHKVTTRALTQIREKWGDIREKWGDIREKWGDIR